jgi:hypothetical protein
MAGKKPTMRENISSRPTDKYGNRATDADLGLSGAGAAAIRKAAAEKIMKREGTTNPGGARSATPMPYKPGKGPELKTPMPYKPGKKPILMTPMPYKPAKPAAPKAPQVIRTTTNMKPTPSGKKR